jgi:hypothetical protein
MSGKLMNENGKELKNFQFENFSNFSFVEVKTKTSP